MLRSSARVQTLQRDFIRRASHKVSSSRSAKVRAIGVVGLGIRSVLVTVRRSNDTTSLCRNQDLHADGGRNRAFLRMIGRKVSTAEHAVKPATAARIYTNKSSTPEPSPGGTRTDSWMKQSCRLLEPLPSCVLVLKPHLCTGAVCKWRRPSHEANVATNYPVPMGTESLKYWLPFDS